MPTFKQIDAFVTLSDAGSISGAARRLGIAQSAASKHVSDFEALFPRPLIDRSGRCAELTVDGAEVLMRARTVLARRDTLLLALNSRELPLKRLRLGVTEVVALTWLAVFLQALRDAFPKVDIELQVEVSHQLVDQVRAGNLDAVIVPETRWAHGLFKAKMGAIDNHWYCAPSLHPGKKSLRLKDLDQFDLLSQGNLARSSVPLKDWLADSGLTPRSVISSSSLLAVLDLMVSGMGIAHLPEPLVRDLLARGQAVELAVRPKSPSVVYVLLVREGDSTQLHKRLIDLASASCDFTLCSKQFAVGKSA